MEKETAKKKKQIDLDKIDEKIAKCNEKIAKLESERDACIAEKFSAVTRELLSITEKRKLPIKQALELLSICEIELGNQNEEVIVANDKNETSNSYDNIKNI